jgi:hypothetical protein
MSFGSIDISVEDKFIILQPNFSLGETLDNFVYLLFTLTPRYKIILDFRGISMTSDLVDFLYPFESYNCQILLNKEDLSEFKKYVKLKIPILLVNNLETKFNEHDLDLTLFADSNSRDAYFKKYYTAFREAVNRFKESPTKKEYLVLNNWRGLDFDSKIFYKDFKGYLTYWNSSEIGIYSGDEIIFARRYLVDFIKNIGTKSLLSQYCLFPNRDGSIRINTFQSNSINNIETKSQLIKAKPFVSSNITQNLYHNALTEFQSLIRSKEAKESQIQRFLEKNPIFLQSIGYKTFRPQIILERDDGTTLRPDFLLEPLGEEWWDILDIKLPFKKIVIDSKRDRYKFSEPVNELVAQLREYASYFDNEKYARRIKDKYGIKCYKPKLIGIIGNEFDADDERQVRRLMTSYTDLEIITFDKLYKICKERPLI